MGLFESDEARRRRLARDEYLWKQGLKDDAAAARQARSEAKSDERARVREAKQDQRDAQRAMERALAERNRQREAKIREAKRVEEDSHKVPVVRRTGGTRGVKLVTVTHHLSPMPVVALPPQNAKRPGPRVLSYPVSRREAQPHLARDEKFTDAAAVAEPLAVETVKAYGAILKQLRNEKWWDELSDAASLTIDMDGPPQPWQGMHSSGFQPVKLRNAPTISALRVAGDGLRIRIAPRIGDTAKAWASKRDLIRSAFKAAGADASNLTVAETARGGIELRFNDRDPFEHIGNIVQAYDPDKGRSLLGLDSNGREVWVTWGGNSGMVVGGVPGSGKTASMLGVFAAMAGEVELHVFDGKAGYDLEPLSLIAKTYNNEGEVHSPLETLRELDKLRVQRAQAIRHATGGNNFWNVPLDVRREHGLVPIFLVLDEVQTWTDQSGMSKEEKAISAEIVRLVRTLIQKARSVGIITVLTTQKPDSVTIPTVIRDNAALKLAFKVSTPEQALTILGAQPADAPTPTAISLATKGRFVMETEGSGIVLGQAGYIAPSVLMESLADAPHAADQSQVAAYILGSGPKPTVPPRPVAPTSPAPSPTPTPSAPPPAHTPSAALPAHIAAVVPTREEAQAMTPEQKLEAMRLIAQLQGNLPTESAPEPEPEPAPTAAPAPAPTITPSADGIVEGEI